MVCLTLASCSSGGSVGPPESEGLLWGSVTSIESEEPVPIANAEIVLVDPLTFIVAAGPVSTDSAGVYRLNRPPAGTYSTLIFHTGLFVFDRTRSLVAISDGDTIRQDFRLIESDLTETSGGYRVRGKVRDAETDAPIAGAHVHGLFAALPSQTLAGFSPPDQDVTDEAGDYALERVSELFDFESGEILGLIPINASKEGYAVFHSGILGLPETTDSTITLDIRLVRSGPTGTLRGRVLFGGSPLPDIRVAVDVVDTALFSIYGKAMIPIPGLEAITDESGRYEISGLTPGFYSVDAAYLPSDGYKTRHVVQTLLRAGDEIELPDLNVLKAIQPIKPSRGAELSGLSIAFEWEPIAGAEYYNLWLTGAHAFNFMVTVGDSARWGTGNASKLLPPDAHIRWYVDAFRADTTIGTFEEIATFTVSLDSLSDALVAAPE